MRVTFKLGLKKYKCFKYEELGDGGGEVRKFSLVRTGRTFSEKETMGQGIQVIWSQCMLAVTARLQSKNLKPCP